MKKIAALTIVLALTACRGPGGPATQTGRTIDHGVQKVGKGIQKAGEKIQDTAR